MNQTKLFSNLYLAKFVDTLAKKIVSVVKNNINAIVVYISLFGFI